MNSNNYFGLHVNGPNDRSHFSNQTGVYKASSDGYVATFSPESGFLDSGMGFSSLESGYISGITDPVQLGNVLHSHGYGVTNPYYVSQLQNAIHNIAARVDCP